VTGAVAEAARDAEIDALESAVSRLAYLLTRTRRHERIKTSSGVPLDRAAMVVLRQLVESGGMRPGELATRLQVEAPHVTRQVQLLERKGYARRRLDPDDRRAQVIEATPEGGRATDRLRVVSRAGIGEALATWSREDLQQLTSLLGRMVDDFSIHAAEAHDHDRGSMDPPTH
jgi:DNA-binding MarR family transcriptional regulator